MQKNRTLGSDFPPIPKWSSLLSMLAMIRGKVRILLKCSDKVGVQRPSCPESANDTRLQGLLRRSDINQNISGPIHNRRKGQDDVDVPFNGYSPTPKYIYGAHGSFVDADKIFCLHDDSDIGIG